MQNSRVVIDKKLILDGYVYYHSRDREHLRRSYWDCIRLRAKECTARAITSMVASEQTPEIFKGPSQSEHSHPPNHEECEAEIVKFRMKQRANTLDATPSLILRTELANVPAGVLSQLPERENLKQSLRRKRRRELPPNPKSLAELDVLPDNYKKTLLGDNFLIYDSKEENDDMEGRVIVFSTRRNLELLVQSSTWFLDGTFKVIFWLTTFSYRKIIDSRTVGCTINFYPSIYSFGNCY